MDGIAAALANGWRWQRSTAFELHRHAGHPVLGLNDLVDAKLHSAVQCNQFLIVSNGEGALIDPAGNMTCNVLLMVINRHFPHRPLKCIFASHQDPDIVASLNRRHSGTDAVRSVSRLWKRFVPHVCTLNRAEGRGAIRAFLERVGALARGTDLLTRDHCRVPA